MLATVDLTLIIIAVVAGLAVLLFELGLLRSVYSEEEQKRRHLKKRLASVRNNLRGKVDDEILRKDLNNNDSAFARFMLFMPGASYINKLIDRGGQKTGITVISIVMILASVALAILGWIFTGKLVVTTAAAFLGFIIPVMVLAIKANKRLAVFEEQLPEALDIIIRALRAGHPFDGALKVVAEELPEPIALEFSVTSAEINYGVSVKAALTDMVRRIPSRQLKSFVTAVLVQKETGGNLAEILENISSVIRGGFKFQRKLNTLSAEGKMSIAVLAGMPIVLGIGMYFINPGLVTELFTNPKGNNLLYGVVVLFIVGFFWAKKIVKIEV